MDYSLKSREQTCSDFAEAARNEFSLLQSTLYLIGNGGHILLNV